MTTVTHGPPRLPVLKLPRSGDLVLDCYSDLHIGSPLADLALFEKHLAETRSNPNHYLVLNGDLFNADMKSSKHGGVYEATMTLDEAIDYLEDQLKTVAHKIVAITGGNHDARAFHAAGIDPVRQLAARLRASDRYMRDGGYLVTSHGTASNSGTAKGLPRPVQYVGFLNHGSGTSRAIHSTHKAASHFKADYTLFGHTHQDLTYATNWYEYYPQADTVVHRTNIVAVSGSYLGYGGYALERTLAPSRLGHTRFVLADSEKHVDARFIS